MRTLKITCDNCGDIITPDYTKVNNPDFQFYSQNGVIYRVDLCDECYKNVLHYTAPLLEKVLRRENGSSEPKS